MVSASDYGSRSQFGLDRDINEASVACSIPGYPSPSDETINRGHLTNFPHKLVTRTY